MTTHRELLAAKGASSAPNSAVRSVVTVIDEGGAQLLRGVTANGKTIEVITEMVKDGNKLILRRTHIGGASPGEVGILELKDLARELGRQQGVTEVIIEGARRSSGRMIGKIPRPIIVQVDP